MGRLKIGMRIAAGRAESSAEDQRYCNQEQPQRILELRGFTCVSSQRSGLLQIVGRLRRKISVRPQSRLL